MVLAREHYLGTPDFSRHLFYKGYPFRIQLHVNGWCPCNIHRHCMFQFAAKIHPRHKEFHFPPPSHFLQFWIVLINHSCKCIWALNKSNNVSEWLGKNFRLI